MHVSQQRYEISRQKNEILQAHIQLKNVSKFVQEKNKELLVKEKEIKRLYKEQNSLKQQLDLSNFLTPYLNMNKNNKIRKKKGQ